ncbi:spirocyclase AveC family protein [Streptomyces sp. NPDC057654]|uniref:spirocyclase AveC family protein n=1 Tax=Streptomyces sp. NPDC057654 TaxID=3346196 RepID=UPI00369249F3
MDTAREHTTVTDTAPPRTRRRPRRPPPVTVMACVGALAIGVELYVLTRWAIDTGVRFDLGDQSSLPPWRRTAMWVLQVMVLPILLALAWWVVRQSRRAGRLTFDAALLIGYLTSFWLSPMMNFRHRGVAFSAAAVHTRSWGQYIPFWDSPGAQHQIELLGIIVGYGGLMAFLYLTIAMMRLTFLRRWPQLGGVRLVAALLVISPIATLVMDLAWVPGAGMYAYTTGVPQLTLFTGEWYRIPYHVCLASGFPLYGLPFLARHYAAKSPDGHGGIWRGSTDLNPRARPLVQVLAVIGLVHICLVLYGLGLWAGDTLSGPHPVTLPSMLHFI